MSTLIKPVRLDSSTVAGNVKHGVCECQGVEPPTVALCGWICTSGTYRRQVPSEDKCAVCLELAALPRTCCGRNAA